MQTSQAIIVVVILAALIALVAVVALASWILRRRQRGSERQRRNELKERFGPEYEAAVRRAGNRGRAEKELAEREERVAKLNITPLSETDRTRFADEWRSVQAEFVDDPSGALLKADNLVTDVMRARGYPMGEFHQRAADISVDHPNTVEHFDTAHAIARQTDNGEASTDEKRQGLLHYRALFDELLESPEGQAAPAGTT
jgi:hypothetical protein